MKTSSWFLLVLFLGLSSCSAQHVTERLTYQLAQSILLEMRPSFVDAKLGPDGKYHRQAAVATDSPTVRLLLLDHPYSSDDDYKFVLAGKGSYEHTQLLKYFSPSDLAYMRRQLTASKLFKFEQAKIRQPWVRVIPLDTVIAINKRLGWRARILARDSLLQRYGSERAFSLSGILFSKDHKRALVNISDDGWVTCVYSKVGTAWREGELLYLVEY
ncbi:hypothetical protein Q3A66_00670 [Hymenobacter sp. BT770]|uniref:hypothetical protein n=1 Tax=Hymenobacter sp. BT770 TaxID=2886942 RepID=UPI001D11515B|nr:hypothetical protein [Hymenobacter sp. BT770]MCC3151817.1 hypothetical protein [Hymenobacter sp. BT770]MDO3413561.1 hypothetical protein [Hymenobacter sp. BT770]